MTSKKILFFWFFNLPLILFARFDNSGNDIRCSEIEQLLEAATVTESKLSDDYTKVLCNEFIELDCNDKVLAYNLLGHIMYNNSMLSEAKALLIKAEEVYREENSKLKHYSINQNYLAQVEIIEKDYESALVHLNKSKRIAIAINNNQLLSFALLNLGLLNLETGKLENAELFLRKTLDIKTNIKEHKGYAYLNLARVFLQQDKVYEAFEMSKASKEVWQSLGHKKGLYFTSFLQSEILWSTGEYDTALEVLIAGRKIGQAGGIGLCMGENYKAEAFIHKMKGNVVDEIEALKKALVYYDELEFEALAAATLRICKISDIANYDEVVGALLGVIENLKKNSQENTKRQLTKEVRLEKEIENIEAKTRKQFAVMGGLFVFLLLIAIFLIRIFTQNKKIKLLNDELHNSKQKIEAQMDLLEVRNEELKNFAYVASHDLKSPLKTISSFTNLIEMKLNGQADKVRPYLHYVKSTTDNMSQMISDLLSHATTENKLNLVPISFGKIIKTALNNLNAEIEKTKAKISVNNTEEDTIICDEIQMIGVIQNMVSNAINYAKPNSVPVIEITTKNDDNTFTLIIKDDGIGIDPKYHSKVFVMFNRLKEKKEVAGTGIGLATCLKVIQLHNGNVELNSAPEKGAEFVIQLPIMVDEVVRQQKQLV